MQLAWGKKVTSGFIQYLLRFCDDLDIDPSWLMACMAFETGRTFDPAITNKAGSGAVGLIQFMPQTALSLATTSEKLAAMDAVEQLGYVEAYFEMTPRLRSLEDTYMAILWPAAIGKPLDYVLFDSHDEKHPKRYIQNAGLDWNKDGVITKAEASMRVLRMLEEGLRPENVVEV